MTFQSNTVNGNTNIRAIPNGSSRKSYIQAANNPDADNCSILSLGITDNLAILNSDVNGTGTLLPLIAQVGGLERLRIDTAGTGITTKAGGTGVHTLTSQGGVSGFGALCASNIGVSANHNYLFFLDAGGEKARISQLATGELS